ncbi:hypothetical protein Q7P37_003377 [Cladosporium fusiforme]
MFNIHEIPSRQPRGSYAKLICLNCRARKIKCNLPEDLHTEPSPNPQPLERACMRCKQQGLDCIVDKTVLGRPSQKRRRPEQVKAEDDGLSNEAMAEEAENEPDVQDFVLSDLRAEVNEIDSSLSMPKSAKPSKREVFETLMDSTHLFSSLMARDSNFATRAFASSPDISVDIASLISADLASSMDKCLVWHYLHSPYTPTLTELRYQLLNNPEAWHIPSTKALFALLCLIALNVPSKSNRIQPWLRQQLQSTVQRSCQRIVFDLPAHEHALYVLDLLGDYMPLALASGRSVAAASIKHKLSTILAKRTAQNLGYYKSASRLQGMLDSNQKIDANAAKSATLEALQWCQWLMVESIIDGFVLRPIAEQRAPFPEIHNNLLAVKRAVETIQMPPAILLKYHHLSSANIEMQAAVAGKQNWLDLTALARLMDSHGKQCESHREYIRHLLDNCDRLNNPHIDEEIAAIIQLRSADLNVSQVRIGGLCIFYGLMSGLRPPGINRDVTPDEAMQVSSEIISNLKDKHDTLTDPTSVAAFIAKYGDPRFSRQEQILQDFIKTADHFRLGGIAYIPPAVPTVSVLLFACREIVENNATRLKGWGGLHPNVDVHLLLLQDVAKRLEGMDRMGGGSDAIAEGSIYASGAKLIKSLCSIVAGWRKTIAEQEVKDAAERGAEAEAERAMPAEFDGVEMFLSGQLFDDWEEWPQVEDLDFSELLADGMEWVDWAQLSSPSEGNSSV